jgi:PadR family transcriptional regulator, regulatory protein AphA
MEGAALSRRGKLTSTSYVVLGLLCTRDWSAYELAQQMERGWDDVWPRAVRGIYNEPKKLMAHGYASRRTEWTGERARTVYAVTDRGREALRAWLSQPCAPPAFESEALVRVLFADQGSIDELRRAIDSVRAHARARSVVLLAQGSGYLDSGSPFPDRVHLLHLVGGFLGEQLAAMLRWADWAESHVNAWHGTAPPNAAPDPHSLGEQVARLFVENLERTGG